MNDLPTLAAANLERLETAFRNRKPADASQADTERAKVVRALRSIWKAPARHVEFKPDFTGEWGDAYKRIQTKLGNGALLALVGTRGSGKTQLAVELMRYTTAQRRPALFVSATSFFMDIKSTYRKESRLDERDVIKSYQKPALLVIDEIGKRSDSEWENNLLFELLNRRYNDQADTVLIDNRAKQDFIAAIGESLASRMNEGGGIIECNWKSFRS